ncbi:MAG: type 1 glutamine amidotransferase [Syntrophales bacterium]|jgi:GMP synthase-like glutamine amidotransferase|nr:type 1 glutamine amidotransferase [Syntrophales bacterium]
MRIHYLQHVPFEGLGSMEPFLTNRAHHLTSTRFFLEETLPPLSAFDWLIIMGGPMGAHDERRHPWLKREKAFIQLAVATGKTVLGICLGAQLIADALGAKVYQNHCREIGWFPVKLPDHVEHTVFKGVFPHDFEAFHWHGDTFDIPDAGHLLASSQACPNQGFIVGDRVIGLQFHLESTPDSVKALVENCGHEPDGSAFVQTEAYMLAEPGRFLRINNLMDALLAKLERKGS